VGGRCGLSKLPSPRKAPCPCDVIWWIFRRQAASVMAALPIGLATAGMHCSGLNDSPT
jgi:hypothetical protein